MAGELGLRNSFRERVFHPLENYRGSDSSGGREIGLIEFMQTRAVNERGEPAGLLNTRGEPITWTDFWNDLGMDPSRITLDNLVTLSDDIRYLAPEMVREFILEGLNATPWYQKICAAAAQVNSKSVVSPWIEYTDVDLEKTEEAETIAEAGVQWGEKTITLEKKAKAILFTDDAVYSAVIPLIKPFLRRVGVMMGASLNKQCVGVLVNGDQPSGDECAVVGTESGNSFQDKDLLRIWLRGSRLSYFWHTMITTEVAGLDIRDLDLFKKPAGSGEAKVALEPYQQVEPGRLPHYVSGSTDLAEDQALFVDPSLALTHLTFMPLRVESERIAMRQIRGTIVSITQGYGTIDRRARIIIDKNTAFSAAGFPDWMTPLD
jgi:hypothetical protein